MKSIVFIGKSHFPNDPRLYYRIIKELQLCNLKIVWFDFHDFTSPPLDLDVIRISSLWHAIKILYKIKPDYIQISDPREFPITISLIFLRNTTLIYDSHEDYYGQHTIKWKQTKNNIYFFSRYVLWFLNLFIAAIAKINFSTDEYGQKLMLKVNRNSFLLPNFVRSCTISHHKNNWESVNPNELKFLYIGSYNSDRGIDHFLTFINRYNSDFNKQHKLHIFSNKNTFPLSLVNHPNMILNNYIPMDKLYSIMVNYDIGICLWQENLKYKRNIPIKILEYMAVGLPVLTSNFGYMKRYVMDSNSGIGIPNGNYEIFCNAIKKFEDIDHLRKYSKFGLTFTEKHTFEEQFRQYYKSFLID